MSSSSSWHLAAVDGARRVGAALCLAGAYQFAVTADLRWLGAIVCGTLVMASGPWHWTREDDPPPVSLPWPTAASWCFRLVPGWLLMATVAVLKASRYPPRLLVWIWLAGAAWLLVGAWGMRGENPPATPRPARRWVWLCGLLIVAFAAFVRGWDIGTVPRYVDSDEGTCTIVGRNFLLDPNRDWFTSPAGGSYAQHLALFYAIEAAGTLVFGMNLGGARIPDVIVGTLSVLLMFDGLRRVANPRVAAVGAMLLAVNHCHLGFSRVATAYIQTAGVVSLAFALFARVWSAPTYFNSALLGVALAMGVQTYQASVVTLPFLSVAMFWLALVNPGRRRALLVPLTLFVLSFAAAGLTIPVSYAQNPEGMLFRSQEMSMFNPANMAGLKKQIYHTDSTAEVVVRHALRGLLVFYKGQDDNPQYGSLYPLADPYTAALIVPGVILAVLGVRKFLPACALVFTAGYLLTGIGMQVGMGYNRITGAIPLAMAIPAIGLVQASETLWRGRRWPLRLMRDATLIAAVTLCAATNLDFYFNKYVWSRQTGDLQSEAGWAARAYLDRYTVHLPSWILNNEMGNDGLKLILYDVPVRRNAKSDPVEYVKQVEVGGSDLFIIHPHHENVRDALLARFPGARVEGWQPHPKHGPPLILVFVGNPRPAQRERS